MKSADGKKKRQKIFYRLLKEASDWLAANQVSAMISFPTLRRSRDLHGPVGPNKLIGTTDADRFNIQGLATIGIHAKK